MKNYCMNFVSIKSLEAKNEKAVVKNTNSVKGGTRDYNTDADADGYLGTTTNRY